MTDEEIANIRARWFVSGEQGPELLLPVSPADQARDVLALLAEVERLRAENGELRDLAQQVATFVVNLEVMECPFCGALNVQGHSENCPVTKARALLASES